MTNRKFKVFENDKEIFESVLTVNTCILKGRLYENPKLQNDVARFSLQISNGKNSQTNEWNKPTYADCTAFGDLAKQIERKYKERDEICIVGKFYSNKHDGKIYKGFIVKDIINIKTDTQKSN